jgi:hypothetical protein
MRRLYVPLCLAFSVLAGAAEKPAFRSSDTLDKLVRDTTAAAVDRFGAGGLTAAKIAITVIDLAHRDHPTRASYRGSEPTYPASVVKLFYLAAAHRQLETGALTRTPELEHTLHHMIVDSSNDATAFVIDALTGHDEQPRVGRYGTPPLDGPAQPHEPLLLVAGLRKHQPENLAARHRPPQRARC